MESKTTLIRIGDFLFKYRNLIFPAVLLTLFFSFSPRAAYYGDPVWEHVKDLFAVSFVFLGLLLRGAVIGFRYIKRGGLNKKVYAENLVTDGFFAVCRNPLYVGNFMIYAGVLLMHGAPEVFLLGMAFFTFVYIAIVAAEEYFLRNEFGDAYRHYCADVPRWRMKFARLKRATQGMQFSWKRALLKDYGTIANGIVSLSLLELMEEVRFYPQVQWSLLVSIIVVTVGAALSVRVAKKRQYLIAN